MPPLTKTVLLALDERGRQVVSLHAKVTYKIFPNGICRRAEDQQPLLISTPDEPLRETDVTPIKTATDFILLTSAIAPAQDTREMMVTLHIQGARWDYAVVGDRRCSYTGPGRLAFSDPEPFEEMPLRYERAYGGVDEAVPDPPVKVALDAFKLHPGVYPRNPVGRGYVVDETPALDGLLLPNVEHPGQRLKPATLVARGPQNWWRQPLPWSCDWFDKTWYPRVTYFGGLPEHLPSDDSHVPEVRSGLVPRYQNERHARLRLEDAIDARFANAASPALVLPFLQGNERIVIDGVTAAGSLPILLPNDKPKMAVRFERRAYEVAPVLDRVLISTEEMTAYVVWRGAWPTPRALPDRLPGERDDVSMELEGVEAFCDGELVPPLV